MSSERIDKLVRTRMRFVRLCQWLVNFFDQISISKRGSPLRETAPIAKKEDE
jgi:hypothetical protein